MTFGRFNAAASFDYDIEGNFYVVDRGGSMLVKYSPLGDSISAVSGRGSGPLQFDGPVAVFARRGTDIYVADYFNHRIQRFDRNLDLIATIASRDDAVESHRFGYPLDVAVTRQGDVVIVDGENRRVLRIDALGRTFTAIGGVSAGHGRLVDPAQVEIDSRDYLYVLDGRRVAVYDPFGSYVQDLPVDLRDPRSISIDRDTLVIADSTTVLSFDLGTRGFTAAAGLREVPVLVRLVGGRYVAIEPKRIDIYSSPADLPPVSEP